MEVSARAATRSNVAMLTSIPDQVTFISTTSGCHIRNLSILADLRNAIKEKKFGSVSLGRAGRVP